MRDLYNQCVEENIPFSETVGGTGLIQLCPKFVTCVVFIWLSLGEFGISTMLVQKSLIIHKENTKEINV